MVTCAALGHKSGRVLATGGEDGKVNTWHLGSPNCIMVISYYHNFCLLLQPLHFLC